MSDVIGEITFKEKPDIAQVFIRQLDRTNQAAMISPDIHQASTYQILANLPAKWREWVYSQQDRYTDYEPQWIYKTYQGHDIGTKENPMLIDPNKPVRRLEGPIDWSDPNIKGRKNVGAKKEPIYEPILKNIDKPANRLQGSIDWEDPNIYSPKIDTGEPPIDYQAFNELVMEAAEQAGLTWQEEHTNSIKKVKKND